MGRTARMALTAMALISFSVALSQDTPFKVRLSTVPISPNMAAAVKGDGTANAQLSGRQLTVRGNFQGLQSPASVARLHLSAATGVRGAAIHDLEVDNAVRGALHGDVQLSRAQVQALRDGRLYIQVHSEGAPEGNLWGWLLP